MAVRIGLEVKLYLDGDGNLVVTTRDRPDLTPLEQTRNVQLNIPLDGAVTAQVEHVVSELDLDVLPDNVRIELFGQDADPVKARELRAALKRYRQQQRSQRSADG